MLRINWNYTESLKDRVTTGRDSPKDVVDYSFLDFWVDDSGDHIFKEIIKNFEIIKLYEYVLDRYMSILIERDVTLSLADALKNLVGSCKDSLDKVISYPIKVSGCIFCFISMLLLFIF